MSTDPSPITRDDGNDDPILSFAKRRRLKLTVGIGLTGILTVIIGVVMVMTTAHDTGGDAFFAALGLTGFGIAMVVYAGTVWFKGERVDHSLGEGFFDM